MVVLSTVDCTAATVRLHSGSAGFNLSTATGSETVAVTPGGTYLISLTHKVQKKGSLSHKPSPAVAMPHGAPLP
jgi:hypothetical protein